MNNTKRILAMLLALGCLLLPAAYATSQDEVSAANFAPDDELLNEGAHGEVDQSAALGMPTAEPLEPYDAEDDAGEITREDVELAEGAVYDGQHEGAVQDDDYVDADDLLPDEDDSDIHFDNDTEPNQVAYPNIGIQAPHVKPAVDVNSMQFRAL